MEILSLLIAAIWRKFFLIALRGDEKWWHFNCDCAFVSCAKYELWRAGWHHSSGRAAGCY